MDSNITMLDTSITSAVTGDGYIYYIVSETDEAENEMSKQKFISAMKHRLTTEDITPKQVYHEEYEQLICDGVDLATVPTYSEVSHHLQEIHHTKMNPPSTHLTHRPPPTHYTKFTPTHYTKTTPTHYTANTRKVKATARKSTTHRPKHNYRAGPKSMKTSHAEDMMSLPLVKQRAVSRAPGDYMCGSCDKSFDNRSRLLRHVKFVHDKVRAFSCEICGHTYAMKQYLTTHILTHSGSKPNQCQYCDFKCTDKSSMRRHVQARHLKLKPHQCSECDKCFSIKAHLNQHKLVHTGERPYQCTICGKKFTQHNSRAKHVRTVHETVEPGRCLDVQINTRGKQHTCGGCGAKFTLKSRLKRHNLKCDKLKTQTVEEEVLETAEISENVEILENVEGADNLKTESVEQEISVNVVEKEEILEKVENLEKLENLEKVECLENEQYQEIT